MIASVAIVWSVNGVAQIPEKSGQLLLTVSDDWNATVGKLYVYERVDGQWQQTLTPIPVNLGRTGLAWGIGLHPDNTGSEGDPRKREGDGKAPAGIFRLGDAFGYPPELTTGLGYQPMRESHYCMDVPGSPLYNQTVDAERVGDAAVEGSSEGMRRDIHYGDQQYKKGIFVAHNPANLSGAGSCIFMHLWKAPGSPTAGCTAMDETQMDRVLAWLHEDKNPVYVALPAAQYRSLRALWGLPPL
ncbi:L,D-transpeptidase family protein [Microbulbifer hydrolyticus]|nr:L,D-transpeptidase family protein [Microbulbifer hydrolyticus]MBB5210780.1 L,D-peptidoglycan transpeptidase YkuD (ErfK/YbiS/YcfS/YnhG family) [Microbulbifer hydrolyticus]